MSLLRVFSCLSVLTLSLTAYGQLPEQLSLDFEDPSELDLSEWLFVAPTPLGVTMADPDETLSVSDGAWNWAIQNPNEVLVGVYTQPLTDSSVETTLEFDAIPNASIGFLNRFGVQSNPDNPSMPFAHGYCVLTSTETVTLIDFDFSRDAADYIRAIAQVPMPDGLFSGGPTDVLFQTIDGPSAADASVTVPKFDFWFGGTKIFDGVEDESAAWSNGYAGIDVWSVDPFAEMTSESFLVQVDSLTIRGEAVPEPSAWCLVCVGLGALMLRQRARSVRR